MQHCTLVLVGRGLEDFAKCRAKRYFVFGSSASVISDSTFMAKSSARKASSKNAGFFESVSQWLKTNRPLALFILIVVLASIFSSYNGTNLKDSAGPKKDTPPPKPGSRRSKKGPPPKYEGSRGVFTRAVVSGEIPKKVPRNIFVDLAAWFGSKVPPATPATPAPKATKAQSSRERQLGDDTDEDSRVFKDEEL